MSIKKHLDKDNLHHAYLIEGAREEILQEVLEFIESLGIQTTANPDFFHISFDSFKVDDARELKSLGKEKGFSVEKNSKKIFVISANSFLLEAQNTLLKMFEEPIENTHFFVVVPDKNALLDTFVSRFYLISHISKIGEGVKDAERFIFMPLSSRIEFIKELLVESEEEDKKGNEVVAADSARSKALKFLNTLESVLHHKIFREAPKKDLKENPKENSNNIMPFKQIFLVRKFLRQPGSSTKTLMESVALVIPNLKN